MLAGMVVGEAGSHTRRLAPVNEQFTAWLPPFQEFATAIPKSPNAVPVISLAYRFLLRSKPESATTPDDRIERMPITDLHQEAGPHELLASEVMESYIQSCGGRGAWVPILQRNSKPYREKVSSTAPGRAVVVY